METFRNKKVMALTYLNAMTSNRIRTYFFISFRVSPLDNLRK